MLDFLFILGQAASAMLLIYGGFLALIPANKFSTRTRCSRRCICSILTPNRIQDSSSGAA